MHIVFCVASLRGGGAERVISKLANSYYTRGFSTTVITLEGPQGADAYPLDSGVVKYNLNFLPRKLFLLRVIQVISRLVRLRKYLKNVEATSVVSFLTETNLFILAACSGLDIKCIVSERTHPEHHKLSKTIQFLRALMYRWADLIVVQTTDIERWFKGKVVGNYMVIPNFLTKSDFVTSTQRTEQILAVGRLSSEKRFDDLIVAFSLIAAKYQSWGVIILGEGDKRDALQTLINSLHLTDRVTLKGFVRNPHEFMSHSTLYVQPSSYEGFPNALLEAMACGMPVVASYEAGEMVIEDSESGLLFPSGDRNRLAAILGRIIEDKQLQDYLGSNAIRVREVFCESRVLPLWDIAISVGVEPSAVN